MAVQDAPQGSHANATHSFRHAQSGKMGAIFASLKDLATPEPLLNRTLLALLAAAFMR